LYQRTSGLERFVNNFALLLSIPAAQIKVVCVHPLGQPCIPDLLTDMLGGFNPYGRRQRRASAAVGSWQVTTEVVPPNAMNETGNATAYEENLEFLKSITKTIENVTTDANFGATLSNMSDVGTISGVAVTEAFG